MVCNMKHKISNNEYPGEKKQHHVPIHGSAVIDEIKMYIRQNCSEHITLKRLADYAYLSPAYLSRHFKQCTGQNVSQYISETRIKNAKHLLNTTNDSITQISLACGYKSTSNFQKSFKKAVGMSASEYRKQSTESKHNSNE